MEHSLNVYRRLYKEDLAEDVAESVAIMGLLHDVCKVNCYHQETRRRQNPNTGRWEDYLGYTFRDPFPLGHGEKSVFLIQKFMPLSSVEALAVRWHMGAYDDAVKGGSRSMDTAMNLTPWVRRLHQADMCADHEDEREAGTVNANPKLSIFAEMKCHFLPVSMR